jgi:spore germination cell wall hydrolase CwlJ-like protein
MRNSAKILMVASVLIASPAAADPLLTYSGKFPLSSPVVMQLNNDDRRSIQCMALNIYYESRGTSQRTQAYVANVTKNRLNAGRYGRSICDVVFQQTTRSGKSYAQWSWTKSKPPVKFEPTSWDQAQSIAHGVYFGEIPDVSNGSLSFMAGSKVKKPRRNTRG